MEYNSHVWTSTSRSILKLLGSVKARAKVLINNIRFSNSIDSLGHHRKVACVSLFSQYYNEKCCHKIRGWFPIITYFYVVVVFLQSTSFCAVNRTMHYRENSFFAFARTAHLWNDLPAEVFLVGYDIDVIFPLSYNPIS